MELFIKKVDINHYELTIINHKKNYYDPVLPSGNLT
jgi:hypothetical protein